MKTKTEFERKEYPELPQKAKSAVIVSGFSYADREKLKQTPTDPLKSKSENINFCAFSSGSYFQIVNFNNSKDIK